MRKNKCRVELALGPPGSGVTCYVVTGRARCLPHSQAHGAEAVGGKQPHMGGLQAKRGLQGRAWTPREHEGGGLSRGTFEGTPRSDRGRG